jgi:1-acyl-sn-glycerol-3-phosphate acyltransferase
MEYEQTPTGRSTREALLAGILAFLAGNDLLSLDDIRGAVEREIDEAGPDALVSMRRQLTADTGWSYYPRDPLAQRIHYILADRLVPSDSVLVGMAHVRAVADRPVAIFANHLSYADANLLEILLRRSGGAELADRITAIAGPKVFTSRVRRFSSLCFGTIRTPQSACVSTGNAVMGPREVARAARRSIDVARERLCAGDALLIFGEGTRSRTREMQPLLAGVERYLDVPGTWILPVGIVGTDALFPIGDEGIHPSRIVVHVGAPVEAFALRARAKLDRRLIVDAIGLAIADLLPAEYRGAYGDDGACAEARRVLTDSRSRPDIAMQ